MEHQNHHANFVDYPPHFIEREKHYEDCISKFFECSFHPHYIGFRSDIPLDSSPCAAAQGWDDESLDATQTEAGTNLSKMIPVHVVLRYCSFILEPSLWHCSKWESAHPVPP
jgi:hypothetical protein